MALKYKHQLFVTTHWYGSLPCLSKGNLIHIDNHSSPNIYNIYNYYENRGELPEDFYLKGFFDLSSSLLYAFRESGQNWLLVEGYEDKKYISYHLQMKNLRIIPLGGCGNVRKVYEFLHVPFASKAFNYYSKKMVCLIDTDEQCASLTVDSGNDKDLLKIRRLNEQDGEIKLVDVNSSVRKETEIEEILNPKQFYDALKLALDTFGEQEDKDAFASFVFDDTATTSRIKGDDSILKLNDLSRNAKEDKQRIISFVDDHKEDIANYYTASPYTGAALPWVTKLEELLS